MTKNEVLLRNIEQLKEPSFGNKKKGNNTQAIRQEWKSIIEVNQDKIKRLYDRGIISDWVECRTKMENDFTFEDDVYALLIYWLNHVNWSDIDEVRVLYRYIKLVSNGDYGLNSLVLLKYHKNLLESIKELIQKEDFSIEDKMHEGNFGELVEDLINLYFYHTRNTYNQGYTEQYDIDRKEIAQIIPDFIKQFPQNCSNLTMYILENNTDKLVDVCADLLHFHIVDGVEYNYDFVSELFGEYQNASDPIYKNSAGILKKTITLSKLSDIQVDYLVENILLQCLDIDSLESNVKERTKHINRLKDYFENKIVEKAKKELNELIENFDDTFAKNWLKAVRRVAVSKSLFKSIEVMVKAFPNHPKIQILIKLLDEASTFKNKPKLYDLNQKPQHVFKDLHFKYLVIEELMYNQEVLTPKFDIYEFAKEYTKREIDVDDEGYEVIAEVKKYFKNLDISSELLSCVTTLYQDSGFGGGSEFINQLQPFWDPGAGDEVFKVSVKAMNDVVLLPNLQKIVGLENSNPSKKLVNSMIGRGIVLEEEEQY